MKQLLKGLYAITDEFLTPTQQIITQCTTALQAGVKILQFRDKNSSDADVEAICITLQQLCEKYGALFVINDRVTLAHKIKAPAVHIGSDDMELHRARTILGKDTLIGVSCYGSLDLAKKAVQQTADYVAFGAVYPTQTKQHAPVIDPQVIQLAKTQLKVPICVIGGITRENIQTIKTYHPDMYAVVSAIFKGDIEQNIHQLNQKIHD